MVPRGEGLLAHTWELQAGLRAPRADPVSDALCPNPPRAPSPCPPSNHPCMMDATAHLSCHLSGGHTDYVRGLAWDGDTTLYSGGWDMRVLAWTGLDLK